jgi:hypothetical protein
MWKKTSLKANLDFGQPSRIYALINITKSYRENLPDLLLAATLAQEVHLALHPFICLFVLPSH